MQFERCESMQIGIKTMCSSEIETYQTKANSTGEAKVLGIIFHLRIGKEECHGDERTNDHSATPAPKPSAFAHEPSEYWRGHGT
jgi:hypothetical protein